MVEKDTGSQERNAGKCRVPKSTRPGRSGHVNYGGRSTVHCPPVSDPEGVRVEVVDRLCDPGP